jgi:hypothetical protein
VPVRISFTIDEDNTILYFSNSLKGAEHEHRAMDEVHHVAQAKNKCEASREPSEKGREGKRVCQLRDREDLRDRHA